MLEFLMPALMGEIAPAVAAETLALTVAPEATAGLLGLNSMAGAAVPAATTGAAAAGAAAMPGLAPPAPMTGGLPLAAPVAPPMAPPSMASIVQPAAAPVPAGIRTPLGTPMGPAAAPVPTGPMTQPPAPVETAGVTPVNKPMISAEQAAMLAKLTGGSQQQQMPMASAHAPAGQGARPPGAVQFPGTQMTPRMTLAQLLQGRGR